MERAKAAAFSALEFFETLNAWFAQRRNGEPETNSEAVMGEQCFYRLETLEAALHADYPEAWPLDYKPLPASERERIRDEALEEAAAEARKEAERHIIDRRMAGTHYGWIGDKIAHRILARRTTKEAGDG